uniref:Uncharacterized protein n=1 Tax=Chromera velia CCMP2878 TaxID=1169474 RepID=A0A0G4FR00_9ALVE|eukprot:Cvel_18298.t1-p1 / transcript=Cvel_18298.t1 / gene=Cvel_18298 / organism=Chromera_velia_CCMP2878 / gene_product=hypothetical protein / transcript_product=hypothetical protein / location=Cvel_scaffold1509:303-1730(-) / protein_length=476 / sequence_SO=supercontig / SO=protein_coding / is_pseudo=false
MGCLRAYDGGAAFLLTEVLTYLSRFPLDQLNGPQFTPPLSVSLGGVFRQEGLERHLWLLALRGDLEGIASSPLPIQTDPFPPWENEREPNGPVCDAAELVGEMMTVATRVGHPMETVRGIYEWAVESSSWPFSVFETESGPLILPSFKDALFYPDVGAGFPSVFETAVAQGELEFMDWLVDLVPDLLSVENAQEQGLICQFAEKGLGEGNSASRLRVLRWLEEKHNEYFREICLDSVFPDNYPSDEVSVAVETGDLEVFQFLEEKVFTVRGRRLRALDEGKELCTFAAKKNQWEMLRYFRLQERPYPWKDGGNRWDALKNSVVEMRAYEIEFTKQMDENPDRAPLEPSPELESSLKEHICQIVKKEEYGSYFSPHKWLRDMQVPVVDWAQDPLQQMAMQQQQFQQQMIEQQQQFQQQVLQQQQQVVNQILGQPPAQQQMQQQMQAADQPPSPGAGRSNFKAKEPEVFKGSRRILND